MENEVMDRIMKVEIRHFVMRFVTMIQQTKCFDISIKLFGVNGFWRNEIKELEESTVFFYK